MSLLIKNGTIVNEGLSLKGSLFIKGEHIGKVILEKDFSTPDEYLNHIDSINAEKIINAEGLHILPGVIDDQVHFREPGNTHKATIASESKAAVLGGVTSYMDMPNNTPATTTNKGLEEKYMIAKQDSYANYSFYLGATNENIEEIKSADKTKVCGIKVFMGSSTGNMLVNDNEQLNAIFKESPTLVATHCEQEDIIKANLELYKNKFGEDIPFEMHPSIRSREACIECTKRALELAIANNTQLHILHISTADEIELIKEAQKINNKISGEVCVHYMWFNDSDYSQYGSKVKCNPAIKRESDMLAIRKAVKDGIIKVVATDHAPHLKEEKQNKYLQAPSGLPLVQHSLQLMLELAKQEIFTIEDVVSRMSHGPAECYQIDKRGYIREGYYADLAIVNLNLPDKISTTKPAYKCGWSPLEGFTFSSSIAHTVVNGAIVVENGEFKEIKNAKPLSFNR